MTGPLRIGTVFPYTTLFRSQWQGPHQRRTHLLQASFERLPRSKRPVRESHFSHISIQQHDAVSPHALRSEEHTSELQSRPHLVCRLLLEKKNKRLNLRKSNK